MCTYVYVCMYVSGSKLFISKEFSEAVPGGPVVASVPKCHESREKVKPEWKANVLNGRYNFATLKGVEALRILVGNLPMLTSQRHLQIMHFFVPLVRLEENFFAQFVNHRDPLIVT